MGKELDKLVGEQVVVDVRAPLLYVGTLKSLDPTAVVLADADVHFCRDSRTTVEVYLIEARRNGVRPNRREVFVMRDEVVSIGRLEDVILY